MDESTQARARRSRDRRGRGRRGPLAWPPVPAMVTRAEAFDELVLEAAERLRPVLGTRWDDVEFVVDEVPPTDPAPWEDGAAVARLLPAEGRRPHRIVVYRRPVEGLAGGSAELPSVVDLVLVQQVALLLGVDVEDVEDGLA